MTKPVATLVLNRNLKDVTDRLVDHLQSGMAMLPTFTSSRAAASRIRGSRYASFVADWPESRAPTASGFRAVSISASWSSINVSNINITFSSARTAYSPKRRPYRRCSRRWIAILAWASSHPAIRVGARPSSFRAARCACFGSSTISPGWCAATS